MSDVINLPKPDIRKPVTIDGKTVTIQVYKADKKGNWILEVVDQYWGSTSWDETFPTAQEAVDEALLCIEVEGIDAFIGEPSNALEDALDNEHNEDIPTINRCAIIIRYKKTFVDWINSIEPKRPITLKEANVEPHIYLADEVESDFEPNSNITVRVLCEEIFETELASWYTDRDVWPANRTWDEFEYFFEYSVMSLVYDLGAVPLKHDK